MLTQVISDIVQCKETIEKHEFDETATKQYIVIPILRSLDWHDSNLHTLEVYPEERVNGGKVDYALRQGDTSLVFIECKRWGVGIEKHQEQICQYAFLAGVEIAVITNGKIWDFYLPDRTSTSERRVIPWEDRIFCSIDLEVQKEAVSDFQKYLSKSNVEQGKAKANAREAFQPRGSETPLPRQRYGLPILRALVELGGSASTKQVLQRVFQLMVAANELRTIDKSKRSDGQFYWDNRTQDMRRELINKGFMKEDSPRGVWEISDAGRNHLLNNGGT
ncbi:MAG: type I restriction enzyme HsdR N-terminal domain-containing protein [Candidatus Poribacteria bacterium]|nr:type I restriction enzyme HsdR N-terminal domain-containing protein [Candidatus Poribacteria bacterium]MDE0484527.1 type I restriction enzyme HsdR N-terminal domain-containing protein [Candidatus Poribacteria bacterium]